MNPSTLVLIVDPQNDFCDLPAGTDSISGQLIFPSLPVPGAHADMRSLAPSPCASTSPTCAAWPSGWTRMSTRSTTLS